MDKIAILTPSRERVPKLERFFNSVINTISNDCRLDFIVGIDRNDPTRMYYHQLAALMAGKTSHLNQVNIILYEDCLGSIGEIWNAMVRMRPFNTSADLFIMGNDDLVFKTDYWNEILLKKRAELDHPFYLSWFDDEINGESHCAFPILSKQWVGAMGYFTPEIFKFFYHDTWVFDIAKKAGLLQYIPDVVMQHKHFSKFDDEYDVTTAKKRTGTLHADDTTLFQNTATKRSDAARYIKGRAEDYLKMKEAGNLFRVSNEKDREI